MDRRRFLYATAALGATVSLGPAARASAADRALAPGLQAITPGERPWTAYFVKGGLFSPYLVRIRRGDAPSSAA